MIYDRFDRDDQDTERRRGGDDWSIEEPDQDSDDGQSDENQQDNQTDEESGQ